MKKIIRTSLLLTGLLWAGVVSAQRILTIPEFRLHDFDQSILKLLGYEGDASISYFREFASVSQAQLDERKKYEAVGCHPFYVMHNGQSVESGYNCRSFYCVGYRKGPKQCHDLDDRPTGGVVEIERRLGLVTVNDERKTFASFPDSQQTSSMKARVAELEPYRCSPFYLMHFDVAVGEGYSCEEVGEYPYFSSKHSCLVDWRGTGGKTCDVKERPNEMDIRKDAIIRAGGTFPSHSSSSSAAPQSSSSSSSVSSRGSSSSAPLMSFPDVVEGKYGYTAITRLAGKGILSGYPDGMFRPSQTVNRAEFSKMLVGGLFAEEMKGEQACFSDVRTEWYATYVCAARRMQWIKGYEDGRFRPERTISKAEAIKIVVASLALPLDATLTLPPGIAPNAWYSPYIAKAIESGIILESTFMPEQSVTRADAAVWIYRAAKLQGEI